MKARPPGAPTAGEPDGLVAELLSEQLEEARALDPVLVARLWPAIVEASRQAEAALEPDGPGGAATLDPESAASLSAAVLDAVPEIVQPWSGKPIDLGPTLSRARTRTLLAFALRPGRRARASAP